MQNNKRKRRRKKKNLIPVIILIVLAIIAVAATFAVRKFTSTEFGTGNVENTVTVDIPQGSTVNDIAEILEENNVVDSAEHFIFLCKINGEGSGFKFGTYVFNGGSDFFEIVEKLNSGNSIDNSIHITVKEGMWLREIAEAVADEGLCSADEFMKAANSRDYDYDFVKDIPERDNLLEGYLYPETYYVQPDSKPEEIVDMMLQQFDKVCTADDIYSKVKKSGKSLDDIVIIASLVEAEVKYDDERPVVASVIYNRLDKGMKLQIDASVIYSIGERVSRVFYSDLEKADEHNTYYTDGLPVGPICSPRASSLAAATEPADTNYLYYVVENKETGKHYFTANYDEFLKASEKYKNTLE